MITSSRGWRPAAALATSVMVLAACADASTARSGVQIGHARVLPASVMDESVVPDAMSAFGLDLLGRLCAAEPAENVLLSPSSISSALGMVYAGARGSTAEQMAKVLHLPPAGDPLTVAVAAHRAELAPLVAGDHARLAIADVAWTQGGLPLEPDYLDTLRTGYGAGIRTVDFEHNPDGARAAINAEVARQTRGHIKELMGPRTITDETRLVLTDAVYLKAKWHKKLAAEKRSMIFTAPGNEPTNLDGVAFDLDTYASSGGWQAVELPYSDGRLAAVAMLPPPGASPCALDAARLNTLLGALRPTKGTANLPALDLKTSYDLTEPLTSMGMGQAFAPGAADFSGITKGTELRVGAVVHQATLLFDDKGTEASAATGVSMMTTASLDPDVHVEFDRPYLLLVRDKASGTPFFLASVVDPARG